MIANLPLSKAPMPSTLRVLMISEPGVDGVFRHVEGLIHFLLSREVGVDLAYSDLRGGADLEELVSYVESRNGRTLNLQVGNRPQFGDAAALVRLRRLAAERRPQAIHAHSSKAGVLGRSLRFVGVRGAYFYTPHAYYGNGRSGKSAAVFDGIESIFGRVGTSILVSQTESLYAYERIGVSRDRQIIIPNGIDCAAFRPAAQAERAETRARLGIPEDAVVLGTVARYSGQKDPLTLYTAVREVLEKYARLWFVHVGKGELWDAVSALGVTHPRIVRVPSFQPMSDFYRALNGFVLPSRYEGFSLSVLEALASGIPLILSRAPGNKDFASFGLDAVYWSDPGSVSELRQAIGGWLSNLNRPNNHREVALSNFQDHECYQRVLRAYENALGVPAHNSRARDSQVATP